MPEHKLFMAKLKYSLALIELAMQTTNKLLHNLAVEIIKV